MKKTIFYILAGIFVLCNIQFLQAQSTARYTITFTSTWNSTDHGTLPGTAHWSDLVGTTHNSGISFWNLGELASPGIENVAELGNNTAFNSEVNTAISGGTADQWLESPFSPFAAISSATLTNVVVSSDFPLLTLASMVAPSPDWFVGLSGYSLIDGSNNWKTNMTLDMFVYDAGTEEGDDYSTSNAATTPQENIFSRINIIPFNDQPIGTLTITLEEVLSVNSEAFESTVSIFPNPVEDHFKIQSSARFGIESIKIYDVLGQNVRDLNGSGRSSVKVYRQGLVAGMYLISLTDGNGNVVTKKILLN